MARVVPFYLSSSRSATLFWALPFLSLILFLFLFSTKITTIVLTVYGLLNVFFWLAITWVKAKDRDVVTEKTTLRFEDKKSTKAILLLHGFADLPYTWKRQADWLASRGYTVIIPCIDHNIPEKWHTIIESHLKYLCETYSHVELWGHSMGGALALEIAPRYPLKRIVLWAPFLAPYLTRPIITLIYSLHRLLYIGSRTFTFFPSHRHGKGTPTTSYCVERTLPIRTFAAMLQTQYRAEHSQHTTPLIFMLSHCDSIVSNKAIIKHFPHATILWAAHPSTRHQLPNSSDWLKNLKRIQRHTI
jgi:alpha-beta hydrolase superfamily lysophospholipase